MKTLIDILYFTVVLGTAALTFSFVMMLGWHLTIWAWKKLNELS